MKRNILYLSIVLLSLLGCSKEERYQTSVVRQFNLYLNGEAWKVNPGISTKPFFIYKNPTGDYFANYTSHYRFSLEDASYWFVATPAPATLVPDSVLSTNLNDLIISQFAKADQQVQISAAVKYDAPFTDPLNVNMISRTGTLRLKATDTKSDKRYTTIRAVVTVNRSAYKVIDESYVESPLEVIRSLNTDKGGVNYTDDFVLFNTKSKQEGVNIRFELLDKSGTIVRTRTIEESIEVLPNAITLVEFGMNDSENPTIQDYEITILSEDWKEEQYFPEEPVRTPEGYTYVGPGEDINKVYNDLKNDNEVKEIKLFLKAGSDYTFTNKTLNDVPKAFHIVGQTPASGQAVTNLIIQGNVSLGSDTGIPVKISTVHFENLNLKPTGDFFRFKNQDFEVEDILFKNCEFYQLPATMWYQQADGDYMQIVNNFTVDNCRFINLNLGGSGLLGLSNKQILPIYNIVFKNSTFHAQTLGSAALITNLNKVDKQMSITIMNCTLVNLGGGDMKFFDLNGANAAGFSLKVTNNLLSGISDYGKGKWLVLNNVTSRDVANNYYTKGFVLNDWGVIMGEEPIETDVSMEELFQNVTSGDLHIKDKTTEIYTGQIGDPYWFQ